MEGKADLTALCRHSQYGCVARKTMVASQCYFSDFSQSPFSFSLSFLSLSLFLPIVIPLRLGSVLLCVRVDFREKDQRKDWENENPDGKGAH